jgi:hypothetical protein
MSSTKVRLYDDLDGRSPKPQHLSGPGINLFTRASSVHRCPRAVLQLARWASVRSSIFSVVDTYSRYVSASRPSVVCHNALHWAASSCGPC